MMKLKKRSKWILGLSYFVLIGILIGAYFFYRVPKWKQKVYVTNLRGDSLFWIMPGNEDTRYYPVRRGDTIYAVIYNRKDMSTQAWKPIFHYDSTKYSRHHALIMDNFNPADYPLPPTEELEFIEARNRTGVTFYHWFEYSGIQKIYRYTYNLSKPDSDNSVYIIDTLMARGDAWAQFHITNAMDGFFTPDGDIIVYKR